MTRPEGERTSLHARRDLRDYFLGRLNRIATLEQNAGRMQLVVEPEEQRLIDSARASTYFDCVDLKAKGKAKRAIKVGRRNAEQQPVAYIPRPKDDLEIGIRVLNPEESASLYLKRLRYAVEQRDKYGKELVANLRGLIRDTIVDTMVGLKRVPLRRKAKMAFLNDAKRIVDPEATIPQNAIIVQAQEINRAGQY